MFNAGTGTFDWIAEVISGESWLSLDAAAKIYGDGALRGSYAANESFEDRLGTIRVTAPEAVNSPVDIALTQAGAEMSGEGEGEGEEPDLCGVFDEIGLQFDSFRNGFGITDPDFDGDGIEDTFTLALLEAACNLELEDDLRSATLNAFDINRMNLEKEAQFESLQEYELGLAALLILSTDMQTAVTNALADQDITLSETYEVVTMLGGVFMPSAVNGLSLAQAYEVFDASVKSANEPYSAAGDFDGDGASNLSEYNAVVVDGGGSVDDFVTAAGDPLVLGGEGEGPPPICGALWKGSAPSSDGVGDLALLVLCVGALLLAQGRRRSGVQNRRGRVTRPL